MKKNTLKIIFYVVTIVLVFYSCSQDDSSVIDGLPDSVVNNDPSGAPPRGFKENWNGHSQNVNRQYFDSFTAVYYDSLVDRSIQWPFAFFSNSWEYITDNYGNFGEENILYVVTHKDEGKAFVRTIFDEDAGSKSLIDFSITTDSTGAAIDEPVALIADVVQNSAFGTHLSPAKALWEDKFIEIFTYDLYTNLEMQADSARVRNSYLQSSTNQPTANTFWFRDWFLPIYENYNGVVAFSNFFRILSQNYPKDGNDYARDMNLGELVHFFSGATGENLQPLAEIAFTWNDEYNNQLLQARAEFPNLNYPFEPASELKDLTGSATITVSKENGGGPSANEGSPKLIDGDTNSKFLTDGFPIDVFWMQQNFTEPEVVNKYTLTSGNDAPDRDLKTWTLSGSNDGQNFELLDTRTDQSWTDRNQTKEFNFNNDIAYKYYRIDVQANNGSTLLQISEWRLLNLSLISFGPEDLTLNSILTVNSENGGGAEAGEGSSKLVDNDTNTKFLAAWTPEFQAVQELPEAKKLTKYTLTSGNDAPERDMKNWDIAGSNDGQNFEVIDTRTDQNFDERNQTQEFLVNSETAYKYFKWSVTTLKEGTVFQVSEWRLLGNN